MTEFVVSLMTQHFKSISPANIISLCVINMKEARLLYFDINSKVIVRNMSTQVTYERNHILFTL